MVGVSIHGGHQLRPSRIFRRWWHVRSGFNGVGGGGGGGGGIGGGALNSVQWFVFVVNGRIERQRLGIVMLELVVTVQTIQLALQLGFELFVVHVPRCGDVVVEPATHAVIFFNKRQKALKKNRFS